MEEFSLPYDVESAMLKESAQALSHNIHKQGRNCNEKKPRDLEMRENIQLELKILHVGSALHNGAHIAWGDCTVFWQIEGVSGQESVLWATYHNSFDSHRYVITLETFL